MFNLEEYGYTETETPPDGLLPGRVIEQQRERYTVVTAQGEVHAALRGAFLHGAQEREDFPSVGDYVFLAYNASGPSGIVRLLPRRTKFSRADYAGHDAGYANTVREQIVAANFDTVFILSSLNRDFKVSRITRYLSRAVQSGAQPVVLLTKADLDEKAEFSLNAVRSAAPGVPVHAVSAHTGFGLDALSPYLQPRKTVVFLGMSGVGKSSLLNTLMRREVMAVQAIREDDARGRHTTTHRQLFRLPSGAMVIDTPGMREMGLLGAEDGIRSVFSGVEELIARCRFRDCRHEREPGCAVQAALQDGSLPQKQWEQYLAQTRENRFADDKASYLQEKENWEKGISKWSKQMKKNGGLRQ